MGCTRLTQHRVHSAQDNVHAPVTAAVGVKRGLEHRPRQRRVVALVATDVHFQAGLLHTTPPRAAALMAIARCIGHGEGPTLRMSVAIARLQRDLDLGICACAKPGGGVFEVINATWGRFLTRLGEAPAKPPHLNGRVDTQQLIDQPFMRNVVNEIAVADRAAVPPKPQGHWSVVPAG